MRGCCEALERHGGFEDWQVRQATQALRIYLANFLKRTDWCRPVSASTQNQAFCALLFRCREVLGATVESLSPGVRAQRSSRRIGRFPRR